jgi:hypothetical protein
MSRLVSASNLNSTKRGSAKLIEQDAILWL